MDSFNIGETRTMRCRVCDNKVEVNVNYKIHEVTCRDCYTKGKEEHQLVGNK